MAEPTIISFLTILFGASRWTLLKNIYLCTAFEQAFFSRLNFEMEVNVPPYFFDRTTRFDPVVSGFLG